MSLERLEKNVKRARQLPYAAKQLWIEFNLSQLCHNRATWVFSRRSTASLQAFYSASLAQECVNSVIRQQQPRLQPIQRQQQFCRLTT